MNEEPARRWRTSSAGRSGSAPELGGVCVEVEDGSRFSAIAGT